MLRHTMVDVISREPVYLFDFDLEILDDPVADILELKHLSMLGAFVSNRSDQSRTSLSGQRKYGEEIGLLKVGMEFAIQCSAGGFDIRNVEEVAVGTACIPRAHRVPHDRVHAVAAGDVERLACLFAVRSAQMCDDVTTFIAVSDEFGLPLDRNA